MSNIEQEEHPVDYEIRACQGIQIGTIRQSHLRTEIEMWRVAHKNFHSARRTQNCGTFEVSTAIRPNQVCPKTP